MGLEPVHVNVERMEGMFRLGLHELGELLAKILSPECISGLNEASSTEPVSISDELWARVIFDYSLAWHKKVMNREHILKTLTPLYLGKVASLVTDLEKSTAEEVEQRLEALSKAFEKMKPYLIERWE